MDIKCRIIDSLFNLGLSGIMMGHVTLDKNKKEMLSLRSCLADAGIMLFLAKQLILPMGRFACAYCRYTMPKTVSNKR